MRNTLFYLCPVKPMCHPGPHMLSGKEREDTFVWKPKFPPGDER
jgi:hypothetical protein